jgi:hypothetical protein
LKTRRQIKEKIYSLNSDLFKKESIVDLDIKTNNTGDNFNYISIIPPLLKDSLAVKSLE